VINISISINLAAMTSQLQRILQRAMNLVAMGLNAGKSTSPIPFELPDSTVTFQFAANEQWTSEHASQEWNRWVLCNGFRDAAEAVGAFLEEVQSVLAYWALTERQDSSGGIRGTDWHELIVGRGQKFHRRGLPDKITFLEKQYGLVLDPTLTSQVLSINTVRNCLVHRNGIVTPRDVTNDEKLLLQWTRLVLILRDEAGEREVLPPVEVAAGAEAAVGNRPTRKEFTVGQDIVLNIEEFTQICWTLMTFGNSCTKAVEAHGRNRGIKFKEPESTS
jgi:hypothetical protein